ncbi:MAG: hypothetical protein ACRDYA_05025 [Egibacteraceae bacterium]
MPKKRPAGEVGAELVIAVRYLVRRGLPVTPATADPVLLSLSGVAARAADPADPVSRTAALDGLLRAMLVRFDDARYAEAVRALFGLPPAVPGQMLTVRREVAARAAGHEVHHFRKRVEPRLVERIAWLLRVDAERFTSSRAVAPRLAPGTARQAVPVDPFAWEVTEHEETLSRLWSAVYALRAELLAVDRLVSMDACTDKVIAAGEAALWRTGLLMMEAVRYTAAYGHALLGPDTQFQARDLIDLAGWTPGLTPEQRAQLVDLAQAHPEQADFIAAIRAQTDADALVIAWYQALVHNRDLTHGFTETRQPRRTAS